MLISAVVNRTGGAPYGQRVKRARPGGWRGVSSVANSRRTRRPTLAPPTVAVCRPSRTVRLVRRLRGKKAPGT